MKPSVLIVGMGDTGAALAERLCDNWEVRAIDVALEPLRRESLAGCKLLHQGDGSSRLVLRSAGLQEAHTAVACTDSDEVNLEVMRLAREEFGLRSLYATMMDAGREPDYRALGVQVVDRHESCSALLESRIEGRKVATSIGLGQGEIVEVEVLANSAVIGQRLAQLSPRRWLVGAVYRGGELIVPHGDTVLREGDRVLLIGEPDILSAIATHIGAGAAKFPMHYGSKIVMLESPGLVGMLGEAHHLLDNSAARQMELVLPAGREPPVELLRCCDEAGYALRVVESADGSPSGLAEAAALRDAAVVVLEPEPLPLTCRLGLRRSRTVKFIDLLTSPVLIPRGTSPYRRVMLALTELPFSTRATQLAIDLVRTMGGQLTLGVVHQPELVVGSQLGPEIEQRRAAIEKLAGMYHLELRVEQLHGNPIHTVVQRSRELDLVVLHYRRGRRSGLTDPDVAQNLIHRAHCSVMVMPD